MKVSSCFNRSCRHAWIPNPISSTVVRNFSTVGVPTNELPNVKRNLAASEMFINFLNTDLPDINEITEINEEFRQRLFSEWLRSDEKDSQFNELKSKFHELNKVEPCNQTLYINPSKNAEVRKTLGDIIDEVEFNNTHKMTLVVPKDLQDALFTGWRDLNYTFTRLLFHYGENF